jgi:hypothetical protein
MLFVLLLPLTARGWFLHAYMGTDLIYELNETFTFAFNLLSLLHYL